MAVADDTHGYWIPLGAPNGDSSVNGLTRCSIWARPAGPSVPGAKHVYMAPCGLPDPVYPTVLGLTVIEVTGMSPYAGIPAAVTASINGATSVSANAAAPTGTALMVTVAASDAAAFTSGPGAGWNGVTGLAVNGGSPIILYTSPAWRTAAVAETASWATGTSGDLSAVTATILVSNPGPAQPNPNWPATQCQIGFGSGALTPPSQITWTDITPRLLSGAETSSTRGKQYELDQTQAGTITAVLDNNDGALTPGNPTSPYFPDVLADVPIRLLMTWQGRTYSVWSGYVERWPQTWRSTTRFGLATITVTDAWSLLGAPLAPCQQEQIQLNNPYAYWTLGDAPGSAYGQNSAAGNSNPLQVVTSKFGVRAATQAFGTNSGLNSGDPSGTLWQQSGLVAADNTFGYCLMCADESYPSLAGGVSIPMWFDPTGGSTQITTSDLILMRGSSASLGFEFQITLGHLTGATPGQMLFTVADKMTRATTTTVVSGVDWLAEGGLTNVTLLLTETTWQVIIDGGGFSGASGTCNLPSSFQWLSFLGSADRYSTGGMLNGAACHIAVFPGILNADQVSQIVIAGYPATIGGQFPEFPAKRIERLMGYGGWAGPRAISTESATNMAGISDIQGSSSISANGRVSANTGQQANQAVTNIVTSDGGWMYADGNGVLCYLSRGDVYGLGPAWLLGENTGEYPYGIDIGMGYDKQLLFNSAQLTQATGTGVPVAVSNVLSETQHGVATYTATVYQQDPNVVADQASWIVSTRSTPAERAEALTVNAAANAGNWPFVLGAEPAQPVQVARRPITASSPTIVQAIIAQVRRSFDFAGGTATASIVTDAYPEGQVLTAGDPVLGQLTGLNVLPW